MFAIDELMLLFPIPNIMIRIFYMYNKEKNFSNELIYADALG